MAATSGQKVSPKKKGSKSRKKAKGKDDTDQSNFRKQYVKQLGGNDEDYEWLQDLDDSEESLEIPQESEKDVDMNQLKTFIKSLGFQKVQPKVDDNENEDEASDSSETSSNDESPSKANNQSKLKSGDLKSTHVRTSDQQNSKDKKETKTKLKKSKQDRQDNEQAIKDGIAGILSEHSAKRTSSVPSPKGQKQRSSDNEIQHAEVSSTTGTTVTAGAKQGTADTRKLLKGYFPRNYLLITRSDEKWYENRSSSSPAPFEAADVSIVAEYNKLAAKLHQDEVALYTKLSSSDTSTKAEWMRKVVASGVLSDKIAALTLRTQKSPLHNVNTLDILLNMVRKKGRREALLALTEVKQLFLEELLPDDRKLKTFSQHPFVELDKMLKGKSRDERDRRLLLWYFEAQLKQKYEAFVASLETMCHDNVSAVKQKAVAAMEELLAAKPEQEKVLLTQLVNKIGDPDNKVASKAVYLLHKLVENQPAMRGVVVKEVEGLLYRVNIRTKAQYYAMCFLNQMILTHNDADLASKLIVIYFSFFKACTKKKDIDQRMLSAVLTGVNRAYPYAKVDNKMEAEVNTLFKVVHKSPFNIGVQALLLLKQVLGESYSISDRFYSALYKKLLDPTLENSPRQPMFLNLLYQTLKADIQVKRNKAFVKRLLQVCESQQPSFICGALFLISELMRLKPALKAIIHLVEGDDEEEHFVDIAAESEDDQDEECKSPEKVDKIEENRAAATDTTTTQSAGSSWVHHKLAQANQDTQIHSYDPLSRNPLYCGAETSALWELQKLAKHFHPSVVLFAEALLRGDNITYTGNPLQDFTLMKFLDRFVYKNPKQAETEKVSVLQPHTKNYKPTATRLMAVNSKKFINTPEDQIPIDELFFHRFFKQQGKQVSNTKMAEEDHDDDDEGDLDLGSDVEIDSDISDEEFDRILDKMEKEGEDEDAFDFAGEFTRKQKSGKKKGKRADSSDDDDDGASSDDEDYLNPDLDDDSDMDYDDEAAEEFKMEGAEDFDEEGFGESDSNDDFELPEQKVSTKSKKPARQESDTEDDDSDMDFDMGLSKKRKKARQGGKGKKTKKQQRGGAESASLKATAEEFATMMDDNVGSKFDSLGLQAMANKDKADLKQLDWEMKRDLWVRGKDTKSKIREKTHQGKRSFNKGKRRPYNRNKKGPKGKSKQKRKK